MNKNKAVSTIKIFLVVTLIISPLIGLIGLVDLLTLAFSCDSGPIVFNLFDKESVKILMNLGLIQCILMSPILISYTIAGIILKCLKKYKEKVSLKIYIPLMLMPELIIPFMFFFIIILL